MGWRTFVPADCAPPTEPVMHEEPAPELEIGARIWWQSPLFGLTTGLVAARPANGRVLVREHAIVGWYHETVSIPLAWLVSTEEREGFGGFGHFARKEGIREKSLSLSQNSQISLPLVASPK
jgi:hypothetical protein